MSRLNIESHETRRIMGQLNQGDDLYEGLLSLCQQLQLRCARLTASGTIDELTVAHYDPESRSWGRLSHFKGAMQLLHVTGVLSEEKGKLRLDLSLIASRHRDNGIEILGGACTRAKVLGCEFFIEAYEDVLLRREKDPRTGLSLIRDALSLDGTAAANSVPSATGQPPSRIDTSKTAVIAASSAPPDPAEDTAPYSGPVGGFPPPQNLANPPTASARAAFDRSASSPSVVSDRPSWADVVMASARATPQVPDETTAADDESDRPISAGDILDHQQFGRCIVQRVDADQEYVTVRLRNGRLVRLSLEVLKLHYEGNEDGHQIFVTTSTAGSNG